MTQQKNGNIIAIITMIFLFGMIAFVTNLAAPMGIVLKNQFSVSNALGMLGNLGNQSRIQKDSPYRCSHWIHWCRSTVSFRPRQSFISFCCISVRCFYLRFFHVSAQYCGQPNVEQARW